jgi:hypothetical protein
MVQPFFFENDGGGDDLNLYRRGFFCWLILAWWNGYFTGVFANFVVQRGGKSW